MFYLVTFNPDLTQFVVEADSEQMAVKKAFEANQRLDWIDSYDLSVLVEDDFTVEKIDFDTLCELFGRKDHHGVVRDAYVFN